PHRGVAPVVGRQVRAELGPHPGQGDPRAVPELELQHAAEGGDVVAPGPGAGASGDKVVPTPLQVYVAGGPAAELEVDGEPGAPGVQVGVLGEDRVDHVAVAVKEDLRSARLVGDRGLAGDPVVGDEVRAVGRPERAGG